jgi:uncharacterized peroxidase-related enzyme
MPRLQPVSAATANPAVTEIFQATRKRMGRVPNLVATMANSPAVANAFLGFSQSLASGSLSPQLRERLALAVGEANQCDYCVAAHTAGGKAAGLTADDTVAARRGEATDPRDEAALRFAQTVVVERGHVSDDDVEQLREAGYDDGAIAEVVAVVALNLFTNYFNHVAATEIDFPVAPQLSTV